MTDIAQRVRSVILRQPGLFEPDTSIDDQTELAAIGIDSLGTVNLLLDIEGEFAIGFTDDLLTPQYWSTVRGISEAVTLALATQKEN